ADAEERARIARRTLAGAVTGLSRSAAAIAEHTRAQQEEGKRLAEEVDLAFSGARTRIGEAIGDGSLLRGEVLARWQDVVGTGEFFRSVENVFSRGRDRLGHALTGRPAPAVAAEPALGPAHAPGAHAWTARSAGRDGAARAEGAWRPTSAARHLAAGHDLSRIPEGYDEEVSAAVRAWQGDVLELVRTEGADRRTRARLLSLGVNAVGVALMIVVFAST